jgi:hypothetical protein
MPQMLQFSFPISLATFTDKTFSFAFLSFT